MINKIINFKINSVKKFFYKAIVLFIVSLLLYACSERNINDVSLNNSNISNAVSKSINEEISKEIEKSNLENTNKLSEDLKIIKDFKTPEVVKDPKMPSGLKTTWQCVYFGSFPQIEVLKTGDELPIDDYALNDDVIYDDELYEKLKSSFYKLYSEHEPTYKQRKPCKYDYLANIIEIPEYYAPILEIDNEKYIIEGYEYKLDKDNYDKYDETEANAYAKYINNGKTANNGIKQYYKKYSNGSIFKYAPIKWRVVSVDGNILTLISDKILTSMSPNHGIYSWEDSDVRYYLNSMDNNYVEQYDKSGFLNNAFNDKEKDAILKTKIKNDPNEYYGTSSGEDTEDFVYIPSNEEVFSGDTAASYGFYEGSGVDDAAKRFRSTIYAKYKGAWWSPVEEYKGNSFWYTRTNGYSDQSISYICDFGYIYSRGMKCNTLGAGVLPMIRVDASKTDLYDAGFVSSDEINKNTYKFKNVNEAEANAGETSETKKENVKKNYEIIEFGTYPQREIVTAEMIKDKMFYLKEGEYILDDELYEKLDKKVGLKKTYIEIDGEKYYAARNWKGNLSNSDSKYLYNNERKKILGEDYHYFKVEPIKWRVLENKNGKRTLISDKVIDRAKFYLSNGECTWMESDILKWLNLEDKYNTPFYKKAFTYEEQEKIISKSFDYDNMKNNYYFGTSCITDENSKSIYNGDIKVYIISEEDLFYGEKASVYGFDKSDGVADVNRRFKTTAYARFQDVWFSKKDDENYGNAFYMTRTNGYDRQNVVYVGEKGAIYNRGINVTTDDIGFLPMIDIKD